MSNGYKVRVYESCEGDGAIFLRTGVKRVDPTFTLSADSADEATNWIQACRYHIEVPAQNVPLKLALW